MTALQSTIARSLYLVVPVAAIVLLMGWQTEWGQTWHRVPPAPATVSPPPLAAAVLPEYRANATPETSRDFIERSLFNPTRRSAPPAAVVENAKPRMQKGQFALTGTLVSDGRATAFLRETSGGKSRRIAKGDTINGMTVTEVRGDRIVLTMGDESEELPLKLATGPRTTVQPAAAVAANAAAANPAAGNRPAPGTAQPRDVGEVLAERRRAARDAEAAAAANRGAPGAVAGAPGAPPAAAQPAAAAAAPPDPQWQSVFQRYQQPRR